MNLETAKSVQAELEKQLQNTSGICSIGLGFDTKLGQFDFKVLIDESAQTADLPDSIKGYSIKYDLIDGAKFYQPDELSSCQLLKGGSLE